MGTYHRDAHIENYDEGEEFEGLDFTTMWMTTEALQWQSRELRLGWRTKMTVEDSLEVGPRARGHDSPSLCSAARHSSLSPLIGGRVFQLQAGRYLEPTRHDRVRSINFYSTRARELSRSLSPVPHCRYQMETQGSVQGRSDLVDITESTPLVNNKGKYAKQLEWCVPLDLRRIWADIPSLFQSYSLS